MASPVSTTSTPMDTVMQWQIVGCVETIAERHFAVGVGSHAAPVPLGSAGSTATMAGVFESHGRQPRCVRVANIGWRSSCVPPATRRPHATRVSLINPAEPLQESRADRFPRSLYGQSMRS
jgi:hypothetical protein